MFSSTLLTGDGGKIRTKGHSSETAYLHQKTILGVGERGCGRGEALGRRRKMLVHLPDF
jgi:hypothetical protein